VFVQRHIDKLIASGAMPERGVLSGVDLIASQIAERKSNEPAFTLMLNQVKKTAQDGFQFVQLDVLISVWDRSFHTADGKYRFLNAVGDPPVSTPGERFAAALPAHFGLLIDWEAAQAWYAAQSTHFPSGKPMDPQEQQKAGSDKAKDLLKTVTARLMLMIETTRQRTIIEARVDMFADEASITIDSDKVRYAILHRPFPTGAVNDALVADYKQHFTHLDDLIDLLVAARLANSHGSYIAPVPCVTER
jgi:hypothetical protein